MEVSVKTFERLQSFFTKSSILDVELGSKLASAKINRNLLSFWFDLSDH